MACVSCLEDLNTVSCLKHGRVAECVGDTDGVVSAVVQTDDVVDLVLKVRILRDLESILSPRGQTVLPPQPRHPGL